MGEEMMEKVTVIGAGSWGTALAMVLADNGHEVRLWGHNKEHIKEINETHENKKYLPGISLPHGIIGFDDLKEALAGVTLVVLAIPTKAIRDVLKKANQFLTEPITIIHVSKGIEPDTLKRISEIIEMEMPADN
jgi:glycerol-3-phosphate dehydrogenase (NAD(P)+)